MGYILPLPSSWRRRTGPPKSYLNAPGRKVGRPAQIELYPAVAKAAAGFLCLKAQSRSLRRRLIPPQSCGSKSLHRLSSPPHKLVHWVGWPVPLRSLLCNVSKHSRESGVPTSAPTHNDPARSTVRSTSGRRKSGLCRRHSFRRAATRSVLTTDHAGQATVTTPVVRPRELAVPNATRGGRRFDSGRRIA
jgi:hypothetical protein